MIRVYHCQEGLWYVLRLTLSKKKRFSLPLDSVVGTLPIPVGFPVFCPAELSTRKAQILDVQTQWLGITDFSKALGMQEDMALSVSEAGPAQLLGVEHPDVITLGVRSQRETDILSASHNLPIVTVRRGGEATIHNKGQLVIYPIVPLKRWGMGVRDFVRLLMGVTKDVLSDLGIESFEGQEPGLYTQQGKIAFLGIQVKKGVAIHGVSINVKNDLETFRHISVCGVRNQALDRVCQYQEDPSLEDLFQKWSDAFCKRLKK